MSERTSGRRAPAVFCIAGAFTALQIVAIGFGSYGYFIDELYYLACARRLDFGYVDHPPLSIGVLATTRALFGESMLAIRLPAILAVAGTAALAGVLARRLGGGAYAQTVAALAVATSPVFLVLGSFFSMNAFEGLLWPLCGLVLLRLLQSDQPRGWLLLGVLFGLGLENKHTTVLLGLGLAVGLLLTPARRHWRTPWPWLGSLIALLLLAPNLLWQGAQGWPSLEFYRNAQLHKNIPTPPLKVLADQVLFLGPGSLPVWIAGLIFYLRAPTAQKYRLLGWAFAALLVLMLLSGSSRPDRIAAYYPILFAAGGVALEQLALAWGGVWLKGAAVALLLASGLFVLPMSLPLFPPARVAAYAQAVGLLPKIERGKTAPIPQWLADRTGWEEFVADVAAVCRSLSPAERAQAVIYVPSYGQAGAVERFGPALGLPPVIASQNSYWMWARGRTMPAVLVAVGANPKDLEVMYAEHRLVHVHRCDYCMSWRHEMPIYVAKGPQVSFEAAWERAKHFE